MGDREKLKGQRLKVKGSSKGKVPVIMGASPVWALAVGPSLEL
jgi:hypothetical protein